MLKILFFASIFLLLSGCSTISPSSAYKKQYVVQEKSGPAPSSERDGAPTEVPSNIDSAPDATPKVEIIKSGSPNKPYQSGGAMFTPVNSDKKTIEVGLASWYGKKYHGRKTSTGETYDMFSATAAHKTMALPSYAKVTNPKNGKSVVVKVNDRGPFVEGRIIDLSYLAARKLGILSGVQRVTVERITNAEIKNESWE